MKKNKLKGLRVDFGSLVDEGANQMAHIALFKRAHTAGVGECEVCMTKKPGFFKQLISKMYGEGDKPQTFDEVKVAREHREKQWALSSAFRESIDSILHSEEMDEAQKAIMLMQSLKEYAAAMAPMMAEMEGEEKQSIVKALGELTAIEAAIEHTTPSVESLAIIAKRLEGITTQGSGEPAAPQTGAVDMPKSYEEIVKSLPAEQRATVEAEVNKARQPEQKPEPVDVLKSLPEEIRKRIEDSEKRAIELEKRLDTERQERVKKELVEKCKTEYASIPGASSEELADVLKSLPEDSRVKVEAILKTSNEVLKSSALFGEAGRSLPDVPGSPEGKLETLAKRRQTETGETYAQAYTNVLSTPEGGTLYRQTLR